MVEGIGMSPSIKEERLEMTLFLSNPQQDGDTCLFVPVGFVRAETCILQKTLVGQDVAERNLEIKFRRSQKTVVLQ